MSWRATTDIVVTGHGTITLEDGGVAVGGTPDADDWAHSRAVRAVGALLNNPWEPVRIEKVDHQGRAFASRATCYHLRGVDALSDVVDAGQPARVRLHLVPFAGPEEQKIIEVPIPRELAGKDVDIELSPGLRRGARAPLPRALRRSRRQPAASELPARQHRRVDQAGRARRRVPRPGRAAPPAGRARQPAARGRHRGARTLRLVCAHLDSAPSAPRRQRQVRVHRCDPS